MDFYQHTQEWIQGEMFESVCIATGGGILVVIAITLFIYGSTPNASSLSIPLGVIGILLLVGGIGMYRGNVKRTQELPVQYEANKTEFIKAEKERVATFDNMYNFGKKLVTGCFIIGLLLLFFVKNPHFKSIGIALIILGVSVIFIDHFSKERAAIYNLEIIKFLEY